MTVKISEVVQLLEEFQNNVYYSDITLEVHHGCSCGCGGDSYTSETWDEMCNSYDETETKCIKFCEVNGFDYDFGIDSEERITSDKHSFDYLWYSYFNCNIPGIPDTRDIIEEFNEEREYYKDRNKEFIEYCISVGFINDLVEYQGV
jgi:hypothetical protein